MASFPTLKTGVVAQYPSDRTRKFATQVYRFMDGAEQRFAQYPAPLKKWTIRLDMLDEAELVEVESFFVSQAGRAGSFSFTDPWSGQAFANCSFDSDEMIAEFQGPAKGVTTLVVKENR